MLRLQTIGHVLAAKVAKSRGTDGTEFDSDDDLPPVYLRCQSINLIGVLSLAKVFDFSRYHSIFEIGCGDMAQAYVIHHLNPHTRYVATDLDPYVIDRCAGLSVLKGIDMRVLDVLSIGNHECPFAGFDLLMSWGMEYALDDAQLLKLFCMVERAGIPYLMCSASTIGLTPRGIIRDHMDARRNRTLIKQGKLRATGWLRSVGKFRRLAEEAGLEMRTLGRFGYHFCVLLDR